MIRWEYGIRQWKYSRGTGAYIPTVIEYKSEKEARAALAEKEPSDDIPLYELLRRRTIRGYVLEEQLIEMKD